MTDETTALAERFIEAAWNRADFATVDELADPEFEVYYPLMPTPIKGAADFTEFLAEFRTGMPDGHFALQHPATQGDTAVFRWDATGTHRGELLGIPPTGREVRWTGISVVQVANGKVVQGVGRGGRVDGAPSTRRHPGLIRSPPSAPMAP